MSVSRYSAISGNEPTHVTQPVREISHRRLSSGNLTLPAYDTVTNTSPDQSFELTLDEEIAMLDKLLTEDFDDNELDSIINSINEKVIKQKLKESVASTTIPTDVKKK